MSSTADPSENVRLTEPDLSPIRGPMDPAEAIASNTAAGNDSEKEPTQTPLNAEDAVRSIRRSLKGISEMLPMVPRDQHHEMLLEALRTFNSLIH